MALEAVVSQCGARSEGPACPPEKKPKAWMRPPLSCQWMSPGPVFPVAVTTSSHPLGELFLTDLCISSMRKTSTSVLVCLTGKCCNRAQLSNIDRRLGSTRLQNESSWTGEAGSEACGLQEGEAQHLSPSVEPQVPLRQSRLCLPSSCGFLSLHGADPRHQPCPVVPALALH